MPRLSCTWAVQLTDGREARYPILASDDITAWARAKRVHGPRAVGVRRVAVTPMRHWRSDR
jgi:predicted NodU family carbamoyl transferase